MFVPGYAGIPRILRLFCIPQKFLLKSSHPKKYYRIKNFNSPKKSFDHPCHLKSRVAPLPSSLLSHSYLTLTNSEIDYILNDTLLVNSYFKH